MRDRDINRVVMKVLKSAGFKVMQAEKREVKKGFSGSGRPQQAAFLANSIKYQPHKERLEVWVGPFREGAKTSRERGNKRTGINANDIVADHILGEGFSASNVTRGGANAARLNLMRSGEIAVPVKAFKRGGSGRFRFGDVQRGLTREKVFNVGKDTKGRSAENKGIRIEGLWKSNRTVLAVRSKKKLGGTWGFPMTPANPQSKGKRRKKGGRRSGKARVAVKYPFVIPLFHLIKRAKLTAGKRPSSAAPIRFYPVAKRVAPRAVAKSFRREFNRQLKVSVRHGATSLTR
jgi:hypothetical protein